MKNKERKQPKVREKLGTMIVCKHCGKTFEKKFNTHYYCSEECRHEVEKAQWRIRSQRYRNKKKLEQQKQQQMEQDVLDTTAVETDTTDRCDN